MEIGTILGTLGTFGGLVAALAIFLSAGGLVMVARRHNRRLRRARHDPHYDPAKKQERDIKQ
jgi:hypothetical protein